MRTRSLLIFILCALMLCRCAWSSTHRETITLWYGATQEERAAYDRMISQFERENPSIKVKAILVPQKYVERKLILAAAGGVPPDVVRFYAHLGGELMSRGGLEPLDELVRRYRVDLKDFYPVGIEQNTYQGKLYGMPWILSPYALFYNKKLFRQAGLDPNKPPTTWGELEEDAMKLTRRDSGGRLVCAGYTDFLYNRTISLSTSGSPAVNCSPRMVAGLDSTVPSEKRRWAG